MSAPRKIWATPFDAGITSGTYAAEEVLPKLPPNGDACLYHHDDVVRDLSSIASHAIDQWESCIESEYAGTSSYDYMIAEVQERRAALAKIAQEG